VYTDKELINHLQGTLAQRNRALEHIYRENRDKVTNYLRANNADEDQAKDVFQEAVIAMYENIKEKKFKGESAIGTYLYSIARYKWLNQIKKNSIRKDHHDQLEQEEDFQSPLATIIEGETKEGVLQLLAELGEACKRLLIMNFYHEASMKEIAKNGHYSSEQIVRNKKYKCLKRLKELINQKPALIRVLQGNG
ncbi:MAG: sigma-70 family RNA polymerase sigma factor, partial [Bacteroidia bacterium]|nr:sigma-70 family RNA polymerase sigma factor [Bacteroidia bacterium]